MKYRMTLTAGQLQLREEPPAFHIRKAGDLPKKGFPDRNIQIKQRGGRDVSFLIFILGYGLGMIVTLWIVIRNN